MTQVPRHVRLHVLRRRVGLQLRPLAEPDVAECIDDGGKVDGAFAEVVRVVLQVDLADARRRPASGSLR